MSIYRRARVYNISWRARQYNDVGGRASIYIDARVYIYIYIYIYSGAHANNYTGAPKYMMTGRVYIIISWRARIDILTGDRL